MSDARQPLTPRQRDEIDRSAESGDDAGPEERRPADAGQQDFAARNVIMSNALQGGASPAAGAVIGSGGEMGMQPSTDEQEVDESSSDSAAGRPA